MARTGPTLKPHAARIAAITKGDPWQPTQFNTERCDESIVELAHLVRDAGFKHIGPDPWSSAWWWWNEVVGIKPFNGHMDPYEASVFAFGATKEDCDNPDTEFGRWFARMLVGLKIEQSRKIGRVENALYEGAMDPQATAAQKLYLQAHKPEKYVPPTRTTVQMEVTDTTKLYRGIDPEKDV